MRPRGGQSGNEDCSLWSLVNIETVPDGSIALLHLIAGLVARIGVRSSDLVPEPAMTTVLAIVNQRAIAKRTTDC